uniref:Uncharacterized protein n=1 Tax=Arundo donax TaxID=35708 RepID=A0A0A9CHH9_ARUDO
MLYLSIISWHAIKVIIKGPYLTNCKQIDIPEFLKIKEIWIREGNTLGIEMHLLINCFSSFFLHIALITYICGVCLLLKVYFAGHMKWI